jgi:hypothetical protein
MICFIYASPMVLVRLKVWASGRGGKRTHLFHAVMNRKFPMAKAGIEEALCCGETGKLREISPIF